MSVTDVRMFATQISHLKPQTTKFWVIATPTNATYIRLDLELKQSNGRAHRTQITFATQAIKLRRSGTVRLLGGSVYIFKSNHSKIIIPASSLGRNIPKQETLPSPSVTTKGWLTKVVWLTVSFGLTSKRCCRLP